MERDRPATIAAKILIISDLWWCRRRGSNPHDRKDRGILSNTPIISKACEILLRCYKENGIIGAKDTNDS
jgi:hypothetical protein